MGNPLIDDLNPSDEDKMNLYELYARLERTDYAIIKMYEAQILGEDITGMKAEYAQVIADRARWRAEINELQSKYRIEED